MDRHADALQLWSWSWPWLVACLIGLAAMGSPAQAVGGTASTESDALARIRSLQQSANQLSRQGRYRDALDPARAAVTLSETELGPEHAVTGNRLNDLGELYRTLGRFDEALPLYRRALAISEKALGPQHRDTATSIDNLGALYRVMGRHGEAVPLHLRALAIYEKILPADDPDIATCLGNLAGAYQDMGRHQDALPLYQRALAIDEKALGIDHPDTAIDVNNLAQLYKSLGRHADALPLYQRALSIYEKRLPPGHPQIATSLNNLAALYAAMARYGEAEPLYRRALTIQVNAFGAQHPANADTLAGFAAVFQATGRYRDTLQSLQRALEISEATHGAEHPGTATLLNNQAEYHRAAGRYAEAMPLYRRALAIHEKASGPVHPETAAVLTNLAGLLQAMGRYADALPLQQRALSIQEQAFGPAHPNTAVFLSNLAGLFFSMGHFDDALRLHQRALVIREAALGPEHPETATALNNLAGLYRTMGRYDQALPLNQRALAIREKVLGPEHPETAISLNNLGQLYESLGRFDTAMSLHQRALAIREKTLGPEHHATANSLNNLAVFYRSLGRQGDALPLYQRALAIDEKALGPDHPDVANRLDNLAGLYRAMARYDDALALYRRALAIEEAALGPDHPSTATTLSNLAGLQRVLGRHDEALPLYRRALQIRERTFGPEHPDAALVANNLAVLLAAMDRPAEARPLLERALGVAMARQRRGADPDLMVTVGTNLCGSAMSGQPPRIDEAIFYCKLAVNAAQQMRAGAQGMGQSDRESLAKALEDPYKVLARLLISRGRMVEAEQVLLALKEAEYIEFVRGDATAGPASPIPLTAVEQQLADEMNALSDELGQVYADLDAHRLGSARLATEALARREARRDLLQQQLVAKLDAVALRLAAKPAEAAMVAAPTLTDATRMVREIAQKAGGEQPVVIAYLPEEQATTVLVTSQQGPVALRLPVGASALTGLVDALRLAIRGKTDYRAPARALHRHLIAPVEKHLTEHKLSADTLMLFLTDRLRYLPFAALMDEDGRHLIEKYRLAVFTAATRDKAAADPIQQWTVNAFGSTQSFGSLSALPAVREELRTIVRDPANPAGLLPGRARIDEQFTRNDWLDVINGKVAGSVIHVATHFQAQPGNWYRSYLLLGNGERFEVADLRNALSANLAGLDLITLLACATEFGDRSDGKEFEGLGALFQKMGARAVIGTLWPVQDEGSAQFMRAFYAARGESRQASKAQALRQAQLALLSRKVAARDPGVDLSHPYYWAPFILMGNWL